MSKPEPFFKEKKREYDRQQYLKKREEILKKSKEYKDNNKDKVKESNKRYYETNKEEIKKRTYQNKKDNHWYYNENIKEYARKWHRKPENVIKDSARNKTRYYNKKKGICNICSFNGKTEFHHIHYNPNRFMEVCLECHKKLHH